jgi:hypothetical protein
LIEPFGATLGVMVAGSHLKTADGVAIYPLARFRAKEALIRPTTAGVLGGWPWCIKLEHLRLLSPNTLDMPTVLSA